MRREYDLARHAEEAARQVQVMQAAMMARAHGMHPGVDGDRFARGRKRSRSPDNGHRGDYGAPYRCVRVRGQPLAVHAHR